MTTTAPGVDVLATQVRQKAQGSTDCAFLLHVAEALQQRCDEIQRLRLAATASEKDAARYRWLRDGNEPTTKNDAAYDIASDIRGSFWDKRIDEELAK